MLSNLSVCLITIVYVILFPLFFNSISFLGYANSVIPIFVGLASYSFFDKVKKYTISRNHMYAGFFSVLISTLLIIGKDVTEHRTVDIISLRVLVPIIMLSIIVFYATVMVWYYIDKIRLKFDVNVMESRLSERAIIVVAISFIIIWIPSWLASFPGTFFGDIAVQLSEYENGEVSRSFPIFHSYFIGFFITLGKKIWGTYNAGIALCVFIQMCILAVAFSFTIKFIYDRTKSKVIMLIMWLMYSFSPVIRLYCKDLVRDVLFSTSIMILSIILYYLVYESEKITKSWLRIFAVIAICFITINLRNIAYVFFLTIMILLGVRFFIKHDNSWKAVVILISVLFINFSFSSLIVDSISIPHSLVAGVGSSSIKENLSVPIQQMARVRVFKENELSEEEILVLDELFPERLAFSYNDDNADWLKYCMNNEAFETNPLRYIEEWIILGAKYPKTYLDAFLVLNCETWYPDTIFDGYDRGETWYYQNGVCEPGTLDTKIPILNELENRMAMEISFSKIPIISLFFSPAVMLYTILFSVFYLLYSGRPEGIILLFPVLLIHIGTLFCPVVVLRYNLLSFFMTPLAIALILCPNNIKN